MMRKCTCLALLLSVLLLMAGCGQENGKTSFSATVMRVDDAAVLVRPNEDAQERKSADLISVGLSQAEITDIKGNAITLSQLAVGMRVDVTYGGSIAESYPAQINDCAKLVAYSDQTQLPNPMIPFDTPDFTFVAGFALTDIPDTVTVDGIWLISGKVAQIDLSTPDDAEGMLRCAVTTGEDISGLHGISFENQQTMQCGDITAELFYSQDKKALARWQRDGHDLVLWFPEISTDQFLTLADSVICSVQVSTLV